jgi:phosphotriesterase-related protein
MTKVVMTVDGPVSPDELGFTLCHMHTCTNLGDWNLPPTRSSWRKLKDAPVTIDTLGRLRMDPSISIDNLTIDDPEMVLEEAIDFKGLGGDTIVDTVPMTKPEMPTRDPIHQREVARKAGIKMVIATGWYVRESFPQYVWTEDERFLADVCIKELTEGCRYDWSPTGYPGFPMDCHGIKAGIIKMGAGGSHVGLFTNEAEEKCFKAGIIAHAETGRLLSLHPNAHEQIVYNPALTTFDPNKKPKDSALHGYMDMIEKGGGRTDRFMIHHACQWIDNLDVLRSVLDRGAYLSFDAFNEGQNYLLFAGCGVGPQNRKRCESLKQLIDEGYVKQLLPSNECGMKMHYKKYGGQGWTALQEYWIPIMKEAYGIAQKDIDTMFYENPKALLAYEE